AIEVAVLVRVHVHPDRQATCSRRHDCINKTVVQKVPWATKCGLGGGALIRTLMTPNRVPLSNRVRQSVEMSCNFFHNVYPTLESKPGPHYKILVKKWTFFDSPNGIYERS